MEHKNAEVKYYKPRFKRWIKSDKWDSIAERLSDISMETITQVMNAEIDGDCSCIIWKNCDYVLDRIREINKNFKGIRMQNNEVIDKDMPKRPISIGAYTDGERIPGCPMCVKRISIGQRKCDNCGQVIYWRK